MFRRTPLLKTYIRIKSKFILGLCLLLTLATYNSIIAQTKKENKYESDDDLMYGLPEDTYLPPDNDNKLFLKTPVNKRFEYDPNTGNYIYKQTIGNGEINYRTPHIMSTDEYLKYKEKKDIKEYFRTKKSEKELEKEINWLRPKLKVNNKIFETIFGGDNIEIIPQGSANLKLGIKSSFINNPNLAQNQRRNTNLDFQQDIQVNVRAKIGTRVNFDLSQNTLATFNFENILKLNYTGDEDQIIQKLELGNVSLPLSTKLIQGSQTLFGARLDLKFGRVTVKSVVSQERGARKDIKVEGGASVTEFEKNASDYEKDKHFFLGHYFRDNYENTLKSLPLVNSQIRITKVEVWVSNINFASTNTRNIVAFMDLGEGQQVNINNSTLVNASGSPLPKNAANNLYFNLSNTTGISPYPVSTIRNFNTASTALQRLGFSNGTDFEVYENARRLNDNEYTINEKLGYISLTSEINQDKILAVAYQYTLNGTTYQVGEFSTDYTDGTQPLYVKLIKGSIFNTKLLTWDLMMKNVYSLSTYNVSPENFMLDVYHLNPETGYEVPFLPEGNIKNKLLLNIVQLDNVGIGNTQRVSDGSFDFIEGVTINSKTGKIIFPVLEPFGKTIREAITDPDIANKYAFDSLYTTTKELAKQDIDRDRFRIKGKFSSSVSSDISLGAFNIPRGSVTVTAGGLNLIENQHYTVDYNLGRVKIIDDAIISSGKSINISLGTQSLFNIQTKTFLGSRVDYKVNDQFNIGGTILNLSEKPLTNKVNIGNEPINNTIVGLDISYSEKLPMLTDIINKIPIFDTKAMSSISVQGEVAHLLPGNATAITSKGIAYLDDFEGAQTSISLDNFTNWELSSTPQKQPALFPEAEPPKLSQLDYNFNRAKLAWYNIDNLFWLNNSLTPSHIASNPAMQSNHYMRRVSQKEVFPFKDNANNLLTFLNTFDLAYYPNERGPYNYDDGISTGGINAQGELNNPETRWAGISRRIETTDFESANIEYIQFWVMDPFDSEDGNPNHTGGKLYFNLGNISEDILNDNRKSFENGLPEGPIDYTTGQNINLVDTTIWGRVPNTQNVVNAFSNNTAARPFQDIGLDGLNDADEAAFFGNNFGSDPSADNFLHYLDGTYTNLASDILTRYKRFNNLEGNSPVIGNTANISSGWPNPNLEDLNRNNNLDNQESYYQYSVDFTPADLDPSNIGNNYIVDVYEAVVRTPDGRDRTVKWYQFRIPITSPEQTVGNIDGFKSIRFIRMFLKGFQEPVVLRFARLELLRGDWRRYTGSLLAPGDYLGTDRSETRFTVSAVNIEENSKKQPVSYVLPPGIERVVNPTNTSFNTETRQNEQSLTLNITDLSDGDARAAYKPINIDLRRYKKLQLFAHAEEISADKALKNNELAAFIRLGTDFNNYYEYEIPLAITPSGSYNTDIEADRFTVWPEANNLEVDLQELIKAKVDRNVLLSSGNNTVSTFVEFVKQVGKANLKVYGNPNLKNVKTILLGVRNYKKNTTEFEDDGLDKSVEVWFNELRMTDFDNFGGSAVTSSVNLNIADIATVALSGNYSNPGFGSLEKKLNERQQETRMGYDLSLNMNLAKLLPKKVGINLPFFYSQSESFITPEFNTLDPDVKVQDINTDTRFTPSYKDSINRAIQEYNKKRSYNFTNIRKNPSKNSKKHFYSLSNISLNYAFTEAYFRDINTSHYSTKTYRGGLNYSYSVKPKPLFPFKKSKWAKGNQFKFVRDFGLNLYPQQYTFSTTIDRMYSEKKGRNNSPFPFKLPEFYQKHFKWDRVYALSYNVSKALSIRFNASTNAIIYEPNDSISRGRVDREYTQEYGRWSDTVLNSIRELGRNMKYHQTLTLTYKVPINKLPFLDFTNLTTSYKTDYDWQRANIGFDSLGNNIQNNIAISARASFNFQKVYKKLKYYKKLDKRFSDRKKRADKEQTVRQLRYRDKKQNKKHSPLYYAKRIDWKDEKPPEDIKVETRRFKNDDGEEVELWREKFPSYFVDVIGNLTRSVKNASFNYTESRGAVLPNYKPTSRFLGSSSLGLTEPGLPFLLGLQGSDYPIKAHNQGLLKNQTSQNFTFTNSFQSQLTGNATIRPIKSLSVNLNFFRNYTKNTVREFFQYLANTDTVGTGELVNQVYFRSPLNQGTFSMSYNTIFTSFRGFNPNDFLVSERFSISQRLAGLDAKDLPNGYKRGYNEGQQDVLIPAFLANYTGRSGQEFSLSSFTTFIPLPTWNINFSGLSKLPYIKDIFQNVNITHAYNNTLTVSEYKSNINTNEFDVSGNKFPEDQISSININEQFSPLLGVNVTLLKDINLGLNYSKSRSATLSMVNSQITEIRSQEFTLSTGYTIRKLALKFIKGASFESDLVTRLNISFRNNQTEIKKLVERQFLLTSGQDLFSVSLTSDYKFSKTVSAQAYFNYTFTNPLVSNAYLNTNTKAGISVRFTIAP